MMRKGHVYRHISNLDIDWACVKRSYATSDGFKVRLMPIYRPGRELAKYGAAGNPETFRIHRDAAHLWQDVTGPHRREALK